MTTIDEHYGSTMDNNTIMDSPLARANMRLRDLINKHMGKGEDLSSVLGSSQLLQSSTSSPSSQSPQILPSSPSFTPSDSPLPPLMDPSHHQTSHSPDSQPMIPSDHADITSSPYTTPSQPASAIAIVPPPRNLGRRLTREQTVLYKKAIERIDLWRYSIQLDPTTVVEPPLFDHGSPYSEFQELDEATLAASLEDVTSPAPDYDETEDEELRRALELSLQEDEEMMRALQMSLEETSEDWEALDAAINRIKTIRSHHGRSNSGLFKSAALVAQRNKTRGKASATTPYHQKSGSVTLDGRIVVPPPRLETQGHRRIGSDITVDIQAAQRRLGSEPSADNVRVESIGHRRLLSDASIEAIPARTFSLPLTQDPYSGFQYSPVSPNPPPLPQAHHQPQSPKQSQQPQIVAPPRTASKGEGSNTVPLH
ncbi:hypothetical protein HDU97_006346 [Phlyctochytrium planicorne]|nr:hypothetical protein HDU97_006346 [Phlyctochytrium planicorne]